jgi:ABC-type nitrate/sulfonate/bicarbonate transport system ATPase subunit
MIGVGGVVIPRKLFSGVDKKEESKEIGERLLLLLRLLGLEEENFVKVELGMRSRVALMLAMQNSQLQFAFFLQPG